MGLSRVTAHIGSIGALVTTSLLASAEAYEPFVEVRRWDVDPAQGMTTLAKDYAPDIKVGTTVIVDDDDTWQDNWEYFGFRGQRPTVDFERQRVIIFVEESACSGEGRGSIPIIALHLFSDGCLVPEFFPLRFGCLVEMSDSIRGYAYAIGIPRSGTPERLTVLLDRSRHIQTPEPNPAEVCTECKAKSPSTDGTKGDDDRRTAPDCSTPLPALGDGLSYVLPNGTPIWLLRHWDGSVSAFDARVESERLQGLTSVIVWEPLYRSFSDFFEERFDEWGANVSGTQRGLQTYSTLVVNDRVLIGTKSAVTPPGKVARPRRSHLGDREVWSKHLLFEGRPKVSVADVLSAEVDSWVVVEGVLLLNAAQVALICPKGTLAESNFSQVCQRVVDLRIPSQCHGEFSGIFAFRRASPMNIGSFQRANANGLTIGPIA